MRQRKVKNEEEKLAGHHEYLITDPKEMKGKWNRVFENQNGIYAEFGCGKGKFSIALAEQHPDRNYIAIEGRGSIILRALERAAQKKLDNIVFVKEYIRDVNEYFAQGELLGVYLNFSDPWPKDRHAKRRLIHNRYLDGYRNILKTGQCIEFKTDNNDFFTFAKGEFEHCKMILLEATEDLHNTNFEARNATTEYEDKFCSEGKKINYCKVRV